jgi:16S rRNA processing protein RimM
MLLAVALFIAVICQKMIHLMIKIGKFAKPHGLDGTLKCHIDDRYIDDVLQAKALFIGTGTNLIPYFIASARAGNHFLVKLEDVNSREDAVTLAHQSIYLSPEDLLEPEGEEDEPTDMRYEKWIGYEILDEETGVIGPIKEILKYPGHFTAQVDYQGKEILIPIHENLIIHIDKDKKQVLLQLPLGLLTL